MTEAKIRIRIKRGTDAEWTSTNPILGFGEIGWITDLGKWFCGNGVDTYSVIMAGDGSQIWWSKEEVEAYVQSQIGAASSLQDVTDVGNDTTNNIEFIGDVGLLFDNSSKVKKGTTDAGNGGNKGVALVCSLDYQLKWEAGRLYTMEQDGFTIREVKSQFSYSPSSGDDDTKGYVIGSRWILDNGNVYACSDATTGAAVWTLIDNGGVQSVQDDGSGVVKVDNTDPMNPIVQFNGVVVDGVTINGDGSVANPLSAVTASGFVESVSDDGNGVATIDNTDPLNPIVNFKGVFTDGMTIGGDGSSSNPLFSTAVSDTFQVLASAMDSTPAYLDTKIIALDSSILFDNSVPSALQLGVVYAPMVVLQGINADSVTIDKGDPVYFDGTQGATNILRVKKADASNSSKMPSVGVAYQTSASGLGCSVVVSGIMTNVTTDPIDGVTPSVGQTLYVKSGGGLTTTKPTGTNLIQNIGKVGKVSGGNSGSIVVSNIQRTNDIPNIADTKIWIGNASGVPTAQSLSGDVTMANSGAVTIANDAVTYAKIQNVSSTKKLLGRVSAGAGDIEEIELSADGTLGGASPSSTIVSGQSAVKNYVDVGLATKEPTLTKGNLTEATSSVLTISGGSSAVIGAGTSIQVKQATTSANGYLSSTDWNTFNGKQDSLVSGTNIKTINGTSVLGSGNIYVDNSLQIMSALGSTIKAISFGFDYGQFGTLNTGGALLSGRLQFIPIYLTQATTLNGVKISCSTTGNYTGNNYNGVGLYTYSGGTLTLVASTANDANFWKPTANTITNKPFSATYSAAAGLYYLGFLYSSSAQTTAPALPVVNIFASPYGTMDFTNSAKIYGSINSQTALPSTQAMSGVAVFTSGYLMFLY